MRHEAELRHRLPMRGVHNGCPRVPAGATAATPGRGGIVAGRGPIPKEQRSRERDTVPMAAIPSRGGKAKRPALPRTYGNDGEQVAFLASTRARWRTWCDSDQASVFSPTDWLRLLDLAPQWDQYARTGNPKILTEIRLNEAKLGATREDRLRLRWKLEGDGPIAPKQGNARRMPRSRRDPRKEAS